MGFIEKIRELLDFDQIDLLEDAGLAVATVSSTLSPFARLATLLMT